MNAGAFGGRALFRLGQANSVAGGRAWFKPRAGMGRASQLTFARQWEKISGDLVHKVTGMTRPGMFPNPTRWLCLALALSLIPAGIGCHRPRIKTLATTRAMPLAADETVEVYVGKVAQPGKRLAIIETGDVGFVDDTVRRRWVEELQAKARRLGANAIEDTRILTKRVSGFVPDPQTPFASVRPGKTEYYFMRATAIRIEDSEPASYAEARPASGWVVEKLPEPPKLPGLRESGEATVAPAEAAPTPEPAMPSPPATTEPGSGLSGTPVK